MSTLSVCTSVCQKRTLDTIIYGCDCWELNLGPLEEQPVLLTAELSFQPIGGGDVLFHFIFVLFCFRYTFLSEFGGVAQICNPGTWEVGVDRT